MALLTDNLVSYYKLDESSGNASDSVGTNTLTNTNSVTYATALINNGAVFAKASSKVLQTSTAILGTAPRTFSISLWIKLASEVQSADDGSAYYLFSHQDNASAGSRENVFIRYAYNGGTRRIEAGVSTSSPGQINSNITLGTSAFHHIVFVANASALTLYIDGSSVGTATVGGVGTGGTATRTTVGANTTDGTSSPTDGTMDEVGVWNRVLDSTEVSRLYNSGAGRAYPFTTASTVSITTASYAVTTIAVISGIGRTVSISPVAYTTTFFTVGFSPPKWIRQTRNTTALTGGTRHTTAWTDGSRNTTATANEAKS